MKYHGLSDEAEGPLTHAKDGRIGRVVWEKEKEARAAAGWKTKGRKEEWRECRNDGYEFLILLIGKMARCFEAR